MRAAVVGILATIAGFGAFAGSASAASPADWMYEPTTFTEIRLTLPPASYQLLEDVEYDEYVEGSFELAETDGVPGQVGSFSAPLTVGVKLKGGLGSRRSINEKAGLKISFGKFVKGQTFLGLEKMTLNNMVQDPSMANEVLAYQAFDQMDVFAPNAGFAYVWVNGRSYGLHLNLETPDKIALEKRFGAFQNPPQHLYEGEYGADVSTAANPKTGKPRWEDFEVDEGKSKDRSDLMALLAAVEGNTGTFSERVAPHADLAQMARMWMTERYIGHWDGYSGDLTGHFLPNNYYLYSDPAGKFQLFPWGTDQTWEEHLDFGTPAGALFEGCMSDAACAALYRQAGEDALASLPVPMLEASERCTANAVKPWREFEVAESEAAKLPPYSLQQTADAQTSARAFIAARPQQLATYLNVALPSEPPGVLPPPCPALRPIGGNKEPKTKEPEAPPVTTPGDESGQGSSSAPSDGSGGSAGSAPPTTSPPPSTRAAAPTIRHRAVRANAVGLELQTAAAGRISLLGKFRTPSGPATACSGQADVAGAGSATVSCSFTAAFKRRLEAGAAYMRLTVTLKPVGGVARSKTTTIRIPKR
jgi:CotH protein